MKKPTVTWMKEQRCLHIETHNCIVNIRADLKDREGRDVTSIEIIPDNYPGESKNILDGIKNNRVITDLKNKLC